MQSRGHLLQLSQELCVVLPSCGCPFGTNFLQITEDSSQRVLQDPILKVYQVLFGCRMQQ
jgi:hypothetical protein